MRILCLLSGLVALASAEYQSGVPHATVINLEDETFQQAIDDVANPVWLLKFYAPWCGHCKRMIPILNEVAPEVTGKMAIGKIDCTVEKSLCKRFGVRGYPTLKYAVEGEVGDYPGGRDAGSIKAFAKKMSAPTIQQVANYEEALSFAETTEEGVAFVGYDPRSSDENPSDIYRAFQKVARKMKATASFVWLKPGEETRNYQFVHRIERNVQPKGYETKERDITTLTTDSLEQFVRTYNVARVADLGPDNFQRIGNNGRPLVIGVADTSNQQQVTAIKNHMTDYVKTLSEEEEEKYYFGVLDGIKWGRFLEQFGVEEGEIPQSLVLDLPNKVYWQNATYKNLFDFMAAVNDGSLPKQVSSKSGTARSGFFGKIEALFFDYFPYSLLIPLIIVFAFVMLVVPDPGLPRGPYDQIPDDDGEVMEEEEEEQDEPAESKKDK